MKKDNTNSYNSMEDDLIEIDIQALLKKLWSKRKLIIRITLISFVIGCIFALGSPAIYESKTTFVPQTSDESSSAAKGIGSLASLAGINLNSTKESTDSYLSPLLYSKLTESEEFSYDIIEEVIISLDGDKLTIREYLQKNTSSFNFNPIRFIKKYTIGLFMKNDTKVLNYVDITNSYNFCVNDIYSFTNLFK